MNSSEMARSIRMNFEDLAVRIVNPIYWDGVGAICHIGGKRLRLIPSNELGKIQPKEGVQLLRLSYTPNDVLITANGPLTEELIRVLSSIDSSNTPFKGGHFSKLFSPGVGGKLHIYYATLPSKGREQIIHPIGDDGAFTMKEVDILGVNSNRKIAATVVNLNASGEHKVAYLGNADRLGQPGKFLPDWNLVEWPLPYDVRSLEGFNDGLGATIYLFVDRKTRQLMSVINDGEPQVILKDVRVLFRTATGAEVTGKHMATALTDNTLVELLLERTKNGPEVNWNVWMRDTQLQLRKLFDHTEKGVDGQFRDFEGVFGPTGFFVSEREKGNQVFYCPWRPSDYR